MFNRIFKFLNNLNLKEVLMLAGAAAVVMFFAIYAFLTTYTAKEKVDETTEESVSEVTVIVAKRDIIPRMKIEAEMLEEKGLPESSVPKGAIREKEELLEKTAKVTILAGDVITERKLYKKEEEEPGMVGRIPADCRAISIQVNDITGVAGFAKPRDYVDLILVEKDERSATTNIILQNVLLLSINQTMERNEGGKDETAITNPTIVTLALRPQEALKLISASNLGEIYLMLRPNIPVEKYVEEVQYRVISANAPEPAENPAEKVEDTTPVEQKVEVKQEEEPVIEIIEGDKILTSETKGEEK